MHVLITVVEHFSGGKELNTELRTCLLPFVDDPMLPVIVRMNIYMGQFRNVRIAQTCKSAEDEGIPVNACSVIGEPDIHHGLQFRSREVATFRVFRFDIETLRKDRRQSSRSYRLYRSSASAS